MSQKQYTTYQADILSFELRDALLGIIKPGRYIGYDQMTEYQAQSSNNVYCRIAASVGISKYDSASPPALDATRSVAVSTQGTIIAEDGNVDLILIISPGLSSGRWHLLFMEHEYTSVAGANPATYGLIVGTDGGGKPTLTSATKRIILGYIWESATPTGFSSLTYEPKQTEGNFGDHDLAPKLWGSEAGDYIDLESGGEAGPVPAEGIIGKRQYTTQNYITNDESLTKALDDLDIQAKVEETARIAIGNRALDSALWGALTDVTINDVSESNHGLMPKLSGEADEFLNGVGAWTIPPLGFIFPSVASTNYQYKDTGQGGVIPIGTNYNLEIATVVPQGYTTVLIGVKMKCLVGAGNPDGRYGALVISEYDTSNNGMQVDGPPGFAAEAFNGSPNYVYWTKAMMVKIPENGYRSIALSYINYSGSTTDWLDELSIKVVAYR